MRNSVINYETALHKAGLWRSAGKTQLSKSPSLSSKVINYARNDINAIIGKQCALSLLLIATSNIYKVKSQTGNC